MNERDAFGLIETMIQTARKDIKDNGFYFLLWGWLVLVAALADYTMLMFLKSGYHTLSWAVLMPLGGLVTMIASIREKSKPKEVKTYIDELMRYVVIAYVISLVIVCFIMPFTHNWSAFYPVLMILYATFQFIAGGALRFKPLQYGAVANWLIAIAAFQVGYDNQLLLLALAVLVGYIIPGHMLKARAAKNV